MEEFDEDDFSDLYADVEVQATSAISFMHEMTQMVRGDNAVLDNDVEGLPQLPANDREILKNAIAGAEQGIEFIGNAIEGEVVLAEEEDDLTTLPSADGDTYESESESEDESNVVMNGGNAGDKQMVEVDYDFADNNSEGGKEKRNVYQKSSNCGDSPSHRKYMGPRSVVVSSNFEDSYLGGTDLVDNDRGQLMDKTPVGRNSSNSPLQSRGFMHAPPHPPLDFTKHGTVHISDSEEDNEAYESDSDGMVEAADGLSNKILSKTEPESSQNCRSQRGPHFSCSSSPSVAHGNDDREKSRKHLKKGSSGPVTQLRESASCNYHPFKNSNSQDVKPYTENGRYSERERSPIRKELKQRERSNSVHNWRTCLNENVAPYGFDVRGLCDMHQWAISHGKQKAMLGHVSNWENMPYCQGSETFSPYFRGFFPGLHMPPAYLSNHYWNIHPSFGYEAGQLDVHNMSGNCNYPEKKRTEMDKALEDNCNHNERIHAVEEKVPFNFEHSRKFTSRYSHAANKKGSQFSKRGNGMQLRRSTDGDYMSSLCEHNDDFMKGKNGRCLTTSYRDRHHLDHREDRMLRDRREVEGRGSGNGRCYSPLNKSDYSSHMENGDNCRRYVKGRPFPFQSFKEPRAPSSEQFKGASRPKFVTPERHVSFLSKERDVICNAIMGTSKSLRYRPHETRHHQQFTETFNSTGSIKYHHVKDHFFKRKHHQHSEVLHWDDKYNLRHPDDTMLRSEGPLYQSEKTLRTTRTDDRYASDSVSKLIDEREVENITYKLKKEGAFSNHFDQSPRSVHPDRNVLVHPRHHDSVDHSVVVGKKSPRRTPEGEAAVYYSRCHLTERNDKWESINFECLNDVNSEKVDLPYEGKVHNKPGDENLHSKFSDNQQDEFLDIEEGQIIPEEINEKTMDFVLACEDVMQNNNVEPASNGNQVVNRLDDQKIQEIIAKMERRRERFKEPITLNRDTEKTLKLLTDLDVEITKGKIERRARKRRWAGS